MPLEDWGGNRFPPSGGKSGTLCPWRIGGGNRFPPSGGKSGSLRARNSLGGDKDPLPGGKVASVEQAVSASLAAGFDRAVKATA